MGRLPVAVAVATALAAAAGCAGAKAAPAPVDCARARCVALTFDDGPGRDTDRLLDTLKQRGVHATFFVLGRQVATHVATARRITAEGHEIGNHTWRHESLTTRSRETVRRDLARTADTVQQATGVRPTLVRPPFGAINRTASSVAGGPVILWTVDPRDWRDRDSTLVYERVVKQIQPGGIVLLHDVRPTTVDAVPRILDTLEKRGYTFVTVSELFGGRLESGHDYLGREDPVETGKGSPP